MSDNRTKSDANKSNDNKWRRPVSFNKSKPNDAKLLKHIGRRNFSGYVKKLIMADIAAKEKEAALTNPTIVQPKIEEDQLNSTIQAQEEQLSSSERLERIKNQMKKTGNGASQPINFLNHR